MKTKYILGLAAALSFVGAAQADTYIEITGATAFRSAAVASIKAAFAAGGNYSMAYANTDSAGAATADNNGSCQIFKGTFPTISGTTIIRTAWNGSVEGVRAVAVPNATHNPLFLKESTLPPTLTTNGAGALTYKLYSDPTATPADIAQYEQLEADLSFSDVAQSATPVSGLTLAGGKVGVVVFSMIASKSWAVDKLVGDAYSSRMPTNVTAQQFRTLAAQGFVPMSFFTGNSADTTKVYLTGRNDGSGTRTSYLAETGVGASTAINQYVVHDRSNTQEIPIIIKTAKGGGFNFQDVATPGYASTVWGSDQDGNGGYISGGDLRTDLSKTSASTAIWEFFDADDSGDYDASEDGQVTPAAKLYLLTWLTYGDCRTARGTGLASARTAEVLGYDGVILSGLAGNSPGSSLSAADKALVANGAYTAWNFQQLYYISSRTGAAEVHNELKSRLNNGAIGSAGLTLGEMNVNRTDDGGTLVPGSPL